jgi:hypothetical protein
MEIVTKFHVLWKWNENNKIKFVVYPKTKYVVFLLQNTYNYSYFLQTMCLIILHVSPNLLSLGNPKPIIMIQNQQEFKIQNYNAPWIGTLSKIPCSFKSCNYLTPLTKTLANIWLVNDRPFCIHMFTFTTHFLISFSFSFFAVFSWLWQKLKKNQDCGKISLCGRNLILCLICS